MFQKSIMIQDMINPENSENYLTANVCRFGESLIILDLQLSKIQIKGWQSSILIQQIKALCSVLSNEQIAISDKNILKAVNTKNISTSR